MAVRGFLRVLGVTVVAAGLMTLAGCDLINSWFGIKVDTGKVQILQGSTDLTTGGTFDFGSIVAGLQGTPVVFTVENTGTATVSLNYVDAVHATDTTNFIITALTTTSVAPGGSTTFTVQFAPGSVAVLTSTISVETSDGTLSFTASGTGAPSGSFSLAYTNPASGLLTAIPNGGNADFGQITATPGFVQVHFSITNGSSTDLLALSKLPTVMTNATGGAFYISGYPVSPVNPSSTNDFYIVYQYLGAARPSENETIEIDSSDGSDPVFTFTVTGSTS